MKNLSRLFIHLDSVAAAANYTVKNEVQRRAELSGGDDSGNGVSGVS